MVPAGKGGSIVCRLCVQCECLAAVCVYVHLFSGVTIEAAMVAVASGPHSPGGPQVLLPHKALQGPVHKVKLLVSIWALCVVVHTWS